MISHRSAPGASPQGRATDEPSQRALRRPLGCGLVVAALAACGNGAPTASLFPLEPGHRWVYDVRSEWENHAVEHEQRVITTEGEVELQGAMPGRAFRRRSADGVEWYLRASELGVFRIASKTDLDPEVVLDAQPRYVLRAPLRAGTGWQHPTTTYLLRRRAEFPPEIRHTHPSVPMNYVIESIEETVHVRAGQFQKCLKVRGQAVLRLFADPVVGWKDMPLTTTEWYCHGPGLVKLVREEPAGSTFLTGGTMTLELTEWK